MSTLLLKMFEAGDQGCALLHHFEDDSRTIINLETKSTIFRFNSSMVVMDPSRKIIAHARTNADGKWGFQTSGSHDVFWTDHTCTEKAEIAFCQHMLNNVT